MSRFDASNTALVDDPELIYLPLWREAFTWVEYLELKASRVYYGLGVPRGDNSPVVVVPGFLSCDAATIELRWWLRRIGYAPFKSGIGVNVECPDLLTSRLLGTIERLYRCRHHRVHLVGHSLGGVLALSAAHQVPEMVASVITLGAPFRGGRINPFVALPVFVVRKRVSIRDDCPHNACFSTSCPCSFPNTLRNRLPARIQRTAVYTRRDGMVDWKVCATGNPDIDFEVEATHVGLIWNAQVYRIIAERLAKATLSQQRAKKTSARRKLSPSR